MLASYLTGCSNQVIIPGSAVSPSNATDSENVDSANSAPLSDSGSVVDIDVVSSGSPILGADGVHRLSNTAYAATIEALTGYELSEADLESLPDDPPGLFENNYERQEPSKVLIDSHLDIAKKAAEKAINTPAVLSKIVLR